MQADLGTVREVDPDDRLFSPELGGGALLDLGVYPVSFAQMVLGTPDRVHAVASRETTGVDADGAMLLSFDDGPLRDAADLVPQPVARSGAGVRHARAGSTSCPASTTRRRSCCTTTRTTRASGSSCPPPARATATSSIEVTECLRSGATESTVMPLDDTLAVQGVLAEAADQLGLVFREDDTAV